MSIFFAKKYSVSIALSIIPCFRDVSGLNGTVADGCRIGIVRAGDQIFSGSEFNGCIAFVARFLDGAINSVGDSARLFCWN
jgi:hypothetical protein